MVDSYNGFCCGFCDGCDMHHFGRLSGSDHVIGGHGKDRKYESLVLGGDRGSYRLVLFGFSKQ